MTFVTCVNPHVVRLYLPLLPLRVGDAAIDRQNDDSATITPMVAFFFAVAPLSSKNALLLC